jgi:hypothetical protein
MRNAEYLATLAEAVGAVRTSMADRRLPELSPEQLAWWFRTITASDIERVMKRNAASHLEIVWRREPDSSSDIEIQQDAPMSQQDWSAAT